MEVKKLKPRAKITVVAGKYKAIFSGQKKAAQIADVGVVGSGLEIRMNKLSNGFKFRATNFRSKELTNEEVIDADYKVIMTEK